MHLKKMSAARSAIKIIIGGNNDVLILLRLPFSRSPHPSNFCVTKYIISDTINGLMDNNYWYERLPRYYFVNNVSVCETLNDEIHYKEAQKILINLAVGDNGKCDGYIDDLIICAVDIDKNLGIIIVAPCTVIKEVYHSAKGDEFIKKNNIVAL